MKSIPPRSNIPAGAQPKSPALKFRTLNLKIEDFEKTINFLPSKKQDYARKLFPKDATGLWIKTDVARLEMFSNKLDDKEKMELKSRIKNAQMSVNSGHISKAAAANLKDSGRFNPEPAPQARHSAQGADLHTPPGSPEARLQSIAPDLNPGPSEKAQGKPNAESPKPSGKTLADFLAEDKPGQDSPVSLQTQAQPVPPKGILTKGKVADRAQGKPNAEASKPNRVDFTKQALVKEFPIGQHFKKDESTLLSLHKMEFGKKNENTRQVELSPAVKAEIKMYRRAEKYRRATEDLGTAEGAPTLQRQNARRAAEDLGTAEGAPTLQRQNARRATEDLGTAEGNQAPQPSSGQSTTPLRQPGPTPQENGRIKNFVNSLTPSDKVLLGSAATVATLGVVGLAAGAILISKDGDDSSSNASDKA